jgi:hypothetical protein
MLSDASTASRSLEKRKPSNISGSGKLALSWYTASEGISRLTPAGMYWPLERVMPLRTLRLKDAALRKQDS